MSIRGRVQSVAEDHRVTTFELFFDLVFVFAVTQLTAYMAHAHTAEGIVQATLLLALFWWSWSAYAWLGNQANAGVGAVRVGMADQQPQPLGRTARQRDHPRPRRIDRRHRLRGARPANQLDAADRRGAGHPHRHDDVVVVLRRVGRRGRESARPAQWRRSRQRCHRALSFGAATYVVGSAMFWFALERKVVWSRIVGAAALVAAWPALTAARPLVGLAIVLGILAALAAVEVRARE